MTPFVVDKEEEREDGDDEAGDDEDHDHQAAVHHAAAQLHPGVEVHHWEILQTTLTLKLSIFPRQNISIRLYLRTCLSFLKVPHLIITSM